MRASVASLVVLLFLTALTVPAFAGHRSFTDHRDFHPVVPEGTEGGDGNVTLVVHAEEADAPHPAVSGAIVSVVYESHEHGAPADGGGGNSTPGPPAGHSHSMVVLETDGSGDATFHVHAEHDVTVTVTQGAMWRREHTRLFTPPGGEMTAVVPLFETRREVTLSHDFPPGTVEAGAQTPLGSAIIEWFPQRVSFALDAAADRGYLDRIVSLHVRMSWDEALPDYADLGLGVGNNSSRDPDIFVDQGFPPLHLPGHGVEQEIPFGTGDPIPNHVPDPGHGNVRELMLVGPGPLSNLRGGEGILVGPATKGLVFLPEGLHLDFQIVAFFDFVPEVVEQGCCGIPGPAAGLVAATLVIAAAGIRSLGRRLA